MASSRVFAIVFGANGIEIGLEEEFLIIGVSFIAVDLIFFPVQQVIHDLRIMHACGGANDGMDKPALSIDSGMRFHAEIPLIGFFG